MKKVVLALTALLISRAALANDEGLLGYTTGDGYLVTVGPAKSGPSSYYPTWSHTSAAIADLTCETSSSDGNGWGIVGASGTLDNTSTTGTYSSSPTYELYVTVTPPSGTTASGNLNLTVTYEWVQYGYWSYSFAEYNTYTTLMTDVGGSGASLVDTDPTYISPMTPYGGYAHGVMGAYSGGGGTSTIAFIGATGETSQTISLTASPVAGENYWAGTTSTFVIPTNGSYASIPVYADVYAGPPGYPTMVEIENAVAPSPQSVSGIP